MRASTGSVPEGGKPPSDVPRSHLYHLEPIGLNTPYTESFTSYITRLSYLYRVPPRALILQEVLPLLKISDRLKPDNRLAWFKGSTGLNGMTPLAAEWVQAVEHLTLCCDLKRLTMLTWCNVVDQSGIVRKIRAWCPNCYDEWHHAGKEIYDPLLWAIRIVEECPRHQCRLLTHCPHDDCQKSLPLLDSWSKPGFCPQCKRFLGTPAILKSGERDQEWCEWVSDAVGELIAFAPRVGDVPGREVIASRITTLMEHIMNGSAEALARFLGVSGVKLRGWQKGLHVPEFRIFLQLCRYVKLSPLHFLTQKLDIAKFNVPIRVRGDKQNLGGDEELQQRLEALLNKAEGPFPSLKDVAQEFKYSVHVLQHKFPQLCQDIARLHQKQLDPVYQKNFLERVLVDTDLQYYSLNEIAKLLGCRVTLIKYRFPDLCRQIVRNRKKKVDLVKIREALNEIVASTEEPPPSVEEVVARLGCSHTTLYRHFPDACHAITQRYRAWLVTKPRESSHSQGTEEPFSKGTRRKPNLAYLQRYLDDLLENSALPPSMNQIAKNVGHSVSVLKYHFPEQCEAIKERLRDPKKVDEQRQVLESLANAEQILVSINEIARSFGCSNSVLYNRFPHLCRVITERRWKLSNGEDLRTALDAVLGEEPPPTMQEVARRLDCPAKNLEYYFPDLCKAIAERHRLAVDRDNQRRGLEALLDSEEPMSLQEAARRLRVNSSSLRQQFPDLCSLIAERYKNYRRKSSDARVQKLCDEVRQAAFLLHSQGIRPDTVQIGAITGKPVKFRMPEVREAFQGVMKELGYEL
jgi:AraC-like DNA-binding protein